MAYTNKIISHPQTGQSIRFLQTAKDSGGSVLEMETTYRSRSAAPPLHYHPQQSEDFMVQQGELTLMLDGTKKKLKQGDRIHIPAGTLHAMWNESEEITVVNWKVFPAMNTEHLLETLMGLAAEGKTGKTGRPSFLQVALTASRFQRVFRLAKPPYVLQQLLFTLLRPLALLAGYRAQYEKYID